jgi:hypothetical protein
MEQIRGTGTDARSDIYSLSATLFQLLTNIVPPDSLNRADVLLNDSPDPVKLICEINPEVSREISEIIHRGMAVSQEKRFSGAREMQKALRDAHNRGNDSVNLIETQKDKAAFGKLDEPTNFGTNLQNGKAELSFENVASGASYPPHKNIDSRTFIAPAAPESKKTKNFFAIIGGLSALLIFAVAAAGFAWFATSKENNQTQSVNSPPANTLPAPPAPVQKANINSTSTEESGIISMEPDWNQTAERLSEKANESSSGKRKSAPTIKQATAETSVPKPVSRNNAGKVPGPTPQPSPKKTPKSQRTEILQ